MSHRGPVLKRRTALKLGALASLGLSIGIAPGFALGAGGQSSMPLQKKQLGFLYDQSKCIGCRSCESACKVANKWEQGAQWRRVLSSGDGPNKVYLSISCNHCARPACVSVCPVSAYQKRPEDGIVVHSPEKCVGCGYCLYACPYHAPQYSTQTERISKCHFCYKLQQAGKTPACVAACPVKALTYGDLNELLQTPGAVQQVNRLPDPTLTGSSLVIIPKTKALGK